MKRKYRFVFYLESKKIHKVVINSDTLAHAASEFEILFGECLASSVIEVQRIDIN